ncbi:MAG: hypothetical protein ACJ760_04285 [Thermoleophilaceae bacterium]
MNAPQGESASIRNPRARWWLLGAAVAGALGWSVVWVVAGRHGRGEFAILVIYAVLPALVPLIAARLPTAAFVCVTVPMVVVEAFLLLWGLFPLAAALPPQLLALGTARPVPLPAVRRWLVAAIAVGATALAVTAFAIPAKPANLVACVDRTVPSDRATDATNAVFELVGERDVTGATNVGTGVELELNDWTSDEAIARLGRRLGAIDGIGHVTRGSVERC